MGEHYIGLMSGTSMDGIDAVVVSFGDREVRMHAARQAPYSPALKAELQLLVNDPDACTTDGLGALDRRVGEQFRDAALAVIDDAGISAGDIVAIGSHGQTIRHQPLADPPYSLQVGDPATIAIGTGVATVADFRRADIAAGGQGAPLVPPFHAWLFGRGADPSVVLNLGGIANLTVLDAAGSVALGFDTGPGNILLDRWTLACTGRAFDAGGALAASGRVHGALLERLLADDYFSLPPPKSTGFEYFNLGWLEQHLDGLATTLDPRDVQATLAELSARSVAAAIERHAADTRRLLVCGGGAHNVDLLARLQRHLLPGIAVSSTLDAGLHPDWVEAVAFAWLAMRRIAGQPGNLPVVTGASRQVVLGALHSP